MLRFLCADTKHSPSSLFLLLRNVQHESDPALATASSSSSVSSPPSSSSSSAPPALNALSAEASAYVLRKLDRDGNAATTDQSAWEMHVKLLADQVLCVKQVFVSVFICVFAFWF